MSNAQLLKKSRQPLFLIKAKTFSFKTPKTLYSLHRFLFRLTNGLWNDIASTILRKVNRKYTEIDLKNSLFLSEKKELDKCVEKIKNEGFCYLPFNLPSTTINELHKFGETAQLQCVLPTENYAKQGTILDNNAQSLNQVKNKFAKCVYKSEDLLKNPAIHQIVLDPALLKIAQDYLGVKPILSSVFMWWSFPVEDIEKQAAAAAQEYHFDMDHLKFFKFFFYLNDVGENNGPHCYVKNSHRRLPSKFLKRGRFSDKDIEAHYRDDALELKGRAGTVLAVDTRGLHKGKPLKSGERLLLQVQFTNSLFGQPYEKSSFKNMNAQNLNVANKYYESYYNFLTDS